jgi:hypothetical protein
MLGRKDDSRKNLGQIRGGVLFHLVDLDQLFTFVKDDLRGLISVLREKIHLQPKKAFVKIDQLAVLGAAKGMTAAKQPDGFDQIGLAVGVLSVDHIDIVSRNYAVIIQVSVIFKMK